MKNVVFPSQHCYSVNAQGLRVFRSMSDIGSQVSGGESACGRVAGDVASSPIVQLAAQTMENLVLSGSEIRTVKAFLELLLSELPSMVTYNTLFALLKGVVPEAVDELPIGRVLNDLPWHPDALEERYSIFACLHAQYLPLLRDAVDIIDQGTKVSVPPFHTLLLLLSILRTVESVAAAVVTLLYRCLASPGFIVKRDPVPVLPSEELILLRAAVRSSRTQEPGSSAPYRALEYGWVRLQSALRQHLEEVEAALGTSITTCPSTSISIEECRGFCEEGDSVSVAAGATFSTPGATASLTTQDASTYIERGEPRCYAEYCSPSEGDPPTALEMNMLGLSADLCHRKLSSQLAQGVESEETLMLKERDDRTALTSSGNGCLLEKSCCRQHFDDTAALSTVQVSSSHSASCVATPCVTPRHSTHSKGGRMDGVVKDHSPLLKTSSAEQLPTGYKNAITQQKALCRVRITASTEQSSSAELTHEFPSVVANLQCCTQPLSVFTSDYGSIQQKAFDREHISRTGPWDGLPYFSTSVEAFSSSKFQGRNRKFQNPTASNEITIPLKRGDATVDYFRSRAIDKTNSVDLRKDGLRQRKANMSVALFRHKQNAHPMITSVVAPSMDLRRSHCLRQEPAPLSTVTGPPSQHQRAASVSQLGGQYQKGSSATALVTHGAYDYNSRGAGGVRPLMTGGITPDRSIAATQKGPRYRTVEVPQQYAPSRGRVSRSCAPCSARISNCWRWDNGGMHSNNIWKQLTGQWNHHRVGHGLRMWSDEKTKPCTSSLRKQRENLRVSRCATYETSADRGAPTNLSVHHRVQTSQPVVPVDYIFDSPRRTVNFCT